MQNNHVAALVPSKRPLSTSSDPLKAVPEPPRQYEAIQRLRKTGSGKKNTPETNKRVRLEQISTVSTDDSTMNSDMNALQPSSSNNILQPTGITDGIQATESEDDFEMEDIGIESQTVRTKAKRINFPSQTYNPNRRKGADIWGGSTEKRLLWPKRTLPLTPKPPRKSPKKYKKSIEIPIGRTWTELNLADKNLLCRSLDPTVNAKAMHEGWERDNGSEKNKSTVHKRLVAMTFRQIQVPEGEEGIEEGPGRAGGADDTNKIGEEDDVEDEDEGGEIVE